MREEWQLVVSLELFAVPECALDISDLLGNKTFLLACRLDLAAKQG
jgi:hypothetical protein